MSFTEADSPRSTSIPASFEWTREATLAIRKALQGKVAPWSRETIYEIVRIAQWQLGTDKDGWVPLRGIEAIADRLGLPVIDVYDVALLHKPVAAAATAVDDASGRRSVLRPQPRRPKPKPSPREAAADATSVPVSPRPPSASRDASVPPSPRSRPTSARSSAGTKPPSPKRALTTLRHQLPRWYTPPPQFVEAADAYDRRHQARTRQVEAVLQGLRRDYEHQTKARCFTSALQEVQRNRFVAPEAPPEEARRLEPARRKSRAPAAAKPKTQWKIEESIWAARREWCDARTFEDGEEVTQRAIGKDWERALLLRGLGGFILKRDDGDDDGIDADGDGVSDEVVEVLAVLRAHARLVHRAFDHYACANPMASIFHVSQNAWSDFVSDVGLAVPKSSDCQKSHLATLFVAVNARPRGADAAARGSAKWDTQRALCRHEWLDILVRAAVARYVSAGATSDVSEAVRRLLVDLLAPSLEPMATHDHGQFRARCCYREETDAVLRRHGESLRVMFERYAEGGAPGEAVLMGYAEWREFCVDLGLLDGQFTLREATLIFVWSRMRVVDEHSERGWRRVTNLNFEDFLEAFVRLATMKSLPTDKEVQEAGFGDAGQMLLHMQKSDPQTYAEFCASHAMPWGAEPIQPAWRCVDHLAMLMIRTVESGTQYSDDAKITRQEATAFDLARGG